MPKTGTAVNVMRTVNIYLVIVITNERSCCYTNVCQWLILSTQKAYTISIRINYLSAINK